MSGVLLPTAPRGSQPAVPHSPWSDTAEKSGKAAARLAHRPPASQEQRERATRPARCWNRKSGRGCDSRAEECKHTLLVALDFSLVFDKARPRKDRAVSIFRHKSIAWRGFFSSDARQLHLPEITVGAAYTQQLSPNLRVDSYQTLFSAVLSCTGYLQRQKLHSSDAAFTAYFPCPSPPPQFFQWGFWLSRAY